LEWEYGGPEPAATFRSVPGPTEFGGILFFRNTMTTRRLTLNEITVSRPIKIVGPEDFAVVGGEEISVETVLGDPRFTLYCIDLERGAVLFVESSDPVAVDRVPFYYQGQREFAVGLVSMPFEVFHRAAAQIPLPPKGLIFVHNVGRCGSTLLSKVLNAIPSVHSLSEPDDLTQIADLRWSDQISDATCRELLGSSVRWRCKPRSGPAADFVAIKPRSEVLTLGGYFGTAFPDSRHFFLYRDGLAWMRTIFRGFPLDRDIDNDEKNREMERSWSHTLPLVKELMREEKAMNPVQIRMLSWVTGMEAYLRLAKMPIPTCAARFEDLTVAPEPMLKQILDFCGIEAVDWDEIREVLGRDSQAGTSFGREERKQFTRELTPELVQDVYDLIASRPMLGTPHVVVPGTLGLSR
jgi:hypothetical protein